MDIDLRVLRYFVTVAEELHFGRAAARLYVSQPAVSKQIRKLEEQLGAPLFVRSSRNVVLTARGERLHADARRLLAIAQDLQRPTPPERIRVAHIFELTTSRIVADAFVRRRPQAELHEHTMHSTAQLGALLDQRLDVAILRITPRMLLEHPTGWQHRLLRLEPLVLVGARGDENEPTAGLGQRPLHVFGDPPESGTYNAHGQFLSALERELGVSMHWLGTPGAFSHCLTHLNRARPPARFLEFDSYARRYAAAGFPTYLPADWQPYYPWSLAWRTDDTSPLTTAMIEIALAESRRHGWLRRELAAGARPWIPTDEPVHTAVFGSSSEGAVTGR